MSSKKKNKTRNSDDEIPTLPDHLIMENILPRLPIKPLMRFKCVCKFWLSTISSLEFANSHLKFFPPSPQFLLFLDHDNPPRRVVSISIDESSRVKEVADLEFKYNGQDVVVVGSCNGLVCLHDTHDKFCLWNPATRCYHYFNGPPDIGEHDKIVALWFGYVPSIDDRIIACLLSSKLDASINVYLFSLCTGKWEKLTSFDNVGFAIDQEEVSVMINDTLYCPPVLDNGMTNIFVGVNLVNGQLSKIPMADLYDSATPRKVKLFKMKGRLSFCSVNYLGGSSEVWRLKRDGSGWLKLYEYYYLSDLDLLYTTDNGMCLLLKQDSQQLMLLDPCEMHLRKFESAIYFDDDDDYIDGSNALEYEANMVPPIVSDEN